MIQIGECVIGTIGWILLLPVIIVTSPVLTVIHIQEREHLLSIIRDNEKKIQELANQLPIAEAHLVIPKE